MTVTARAFSIITRHRNYRPIPIIYCFYSLDAVDYDGYQDRAMIHIPEKLIIDMPYTVTLYTDFLLTANNLHNEMYAGDWPAVVTLELLSS